MSELQFDATDQAILDRIVAERDQIVGARTGDYVRFPTGELERFSHNWDDVLQTSPEWAGSYYLTSCGASFSGSLNPSIPRESLTLSDETKDGKFWFFHHGHAGAGRGVHFTSPCRVFTTNAEYQGFIRKHSACCRCR